MSENQTPVKTVTGKYLTVFEEFKRGDQLTIREKVSYKFIRGIFVRVSNGKVILHVCGDGAWKLLDAHYESIFPLAWEKDKFDDELIVTSYGNYAEELDLYEEYRGEHAILTFEDQVPFGWLEKLECCEEFMDLTIGDYKNLNTPIEITERDGSRFTAKVEEVYPGHYFTYYVKDDPEIHCFCANELGTMKYKILRNELPPERLKERLEEFLFDVGDVLDFYYYNFIVSRGIVIDFCDEWVEYLNLQTMEQETFDLEDIEEGLYFKSTGLNNMRSFLKNYRIEEARGLVVGPSNTTDETKTPSDEAKITPDQINKTPLMAQLNKSVLDGVGYGIKDLRNMGITKRTLPWAKKSEKVVIKLTGKRVYDDIF